MLKDQIYLRSVKIDTKVDIDFNAYPFNIAAVKKALKKNRLALLLLKQKEGEAIT